MSVPRKISPGPSSWSNPAPSLRKVDTRAADQREAREAVQAARAAVEAARLNVEFTEVKAPISGRIGRHW